MTEILTSAQMRAAELAAIESGAVTGLALMERAGEGTIEAIFETRPDLNTPLPDTALPRRALVLCGPGNNGGDGFVVARLLHYKGWQVDVFLYGSPQNLPPDAKTNHDRWLKLGPVHMIDARALAALPRPDLCIDALFGIGLTRPLSGSLLDLANALQSIAPRCFTVAIDIPSGLDADTGDVLGVAIPADLTVTFHTAKPGHAGGEGPRYCGNLVVKDIGL